MGLIKKVTLEERPEEGDGVSHADRWNKSIPEEGRSNARTGASGKLKQQPGDQGQEEREMKPGPNKPADPENSHSRGHTHCHKDSQSGRRWVCWLVGWLAGFITPFSLRGNIWQCLERVWVVTTGRGIANGIYLVYGI